MYSLPMRTTLAALTIASAASTAPTRPLVSTIPSASIDMAGTLARDAIIRRLLGSAAAFAFFLAGAVFVTRPLAFHAATHTIVGPDPLSHLWMVSWLTGHAFDGRLFGGNIFHPADNAVLFTDLSLGTAVLVLPL